MAKIPGPDLGVLVTTTVGLQVEIYLKATRDLIGFVAASIKVPDFQCRGYAPLEDGAGGAVVEALKRLGLGRAASGRIVRTRQFYDI